jgi:hypothetical protein
LHSVHGSEEDKLIVRGNELVERKGDVEVQKSNMRLVWTLGGRESVRQ